ELAHLRNNGVDIGLTVSGPFQSTAIRKAQEVFFDGAPLFATIQATWNLLEPSAGTALLEAHAAGMGVIVKEALANGRLTDRNLDSTFSSRRLILQQEAIRLNTGIDALALAACIAQPWVDIVLSGAATVKQLLSNLTAQQINLDEEARSELGKLAQPAEEYWGIRNNMPWN